MIKIEKYQIYEDECFDELLLRFFNFLTIKLRMFVLHLNLYGYDFLNGAGREERKVCCILRVIYYLYFELRDIVASINGIRFDINL